ncbi:unnamed protein product [Aphanomyces euteiches]|uniref:Uncharacterized protein n=1 Tax=Aphanomyces euteiches TaxID=100861 RepID=A0A6G0X4G1_9STRA|nr:hypothetical protein Ae201684_008673 [Aphanomyces euteiches]KAH9085708.1 hypothetical protein Ae201684P_005411 [Aphanomyces euteiches]KAH9155234.1 hypothetical protein AeRB84_002780 [Aphanomyces euteiches]
MNVVPPPGDVGHLVPPVNPALLVPVAPRPIVLQLPKKDVPPPLSLATEVRATKDAARNRLTVQVKPGAGVLYSLLNPLSHDYEPPDVTWIELLEAIALLPSGKPQGMVEIIAEVYRIMPFGDFRNRFQSDFRHELYVKSKMTPREGLILKDKVNRFLRAVMADPIHGYITSKTHIHGDLFSDDVVITSVGKGYVRAYRASDGFYIVVFAWGHGFIHESSLRASNTTRMKEQTNKRPLDSTLDATASAQKHQKTNVLDDMMHRPPDSIVSKAFLKELARVRQEARQDNLQ